MMLGRLLGRPPPLELHRTRLEILADRLRSLPPLHFRELAAQDGSKPAEKFPLARSLEVVDVEPAASQRALQEVTAVDKIAQSIAAGQHPARHRHEHGSFAFLVPDTRKELDPSLSVSRASALKNVKKRFVFRHGLTGRTYMGLTSTSPRSERSRPFPTRQRPR